MGQGNYKQRIIYAQEVPSTSKPGHSSIFINPHSNLGFNHELPSAATTLYETFRSSAIKFSSRNFLRKLSKNHGHFTWKTYEEVYKFSLEIGFGLNYLKLTEPTDVGHAFVGIYSKSREEWLVADFACISQSIVSVPLYDVQRSESMELIINETCMKGIFCSYKLLRNLLGLRKQGSLQSLLVIIQFEKVDEEDRNEASELNLRLFSIKEISKISPTGVEHPPYPNSWFTICYTSGTTGKSKGAIITHSNIIATMAGVFYTSLRLNNEDLHLSYLPLAHMMERAVCHLITSVGGSIGFFTGDISHIYNDLQVLKPTFFMSVPRIYKRFYDDIRKIISETAGTKQKITKKALSVKMENYEKKGKFTHKIWDRLVFKKFRALVGGRVKVMVTGSAAISEEILKFLRVAFSCAIIEGYGQTESCAGSVLTSIHDVSLGHIGGPIVTVELKLVDDEEMGYRSTDKNEIGESLPRGEICLRGPTIFQGYFKSPNETALVIDEEGWLHTGDIGCILPRIFALKLLDRKKNYFKLAQGEFVAAEKIEQIYLMCPLISQIFVHGEALQNYLVAVVVPDENYVREKYTYLQEAPFEEICTMVELKKEILSQMTQIAKEQKLLGFEVVRKIYVEHNVWNGENLLTPTLKLIRHQARAKYSEVFNQMYVENN